MRLIFGITCLLLGVGMLSCRMGSVGIASIDQAKPHVAAKIPAGGWVRTVDGWERIDSWYLSPATPPPLHPIVVAAGQGLVSLLALAACQRAR